MAGPVIPTMPTPQPDVLRAYNAACRASRRAALLAPPAKMPRIYRAPPARPERLWVMEGDNVEIHWPDHIEQGVVIDDPQTGDAIASDASDAMVRVRWPDGGVTRHVAAHMELERVGGGGRFAWRLHLPTEELARPRAHPLDLTRSSARRRLARAVDRFLIAHELRLERLVLRRAEERLRFVLRRAEDGAVSEWVIEVPLATLGADAVVLPSELADMLAWKMARRARGEPAQNACVDTTEADAWHPDRVGTRCGLGLRRYLQARYGLARRPRIALPCRSDRTQTACASAHWGARCLTLDAPTPPVAAMVLRGAAVALLGFLPRP